MDQNKAHLNILQASLSESKSYNEKLSIICSQLESNQTALNLALEKSDQMKEANDALLILIETQLAVFLANFHLSESADQQPSAGTLTEKYQRIVAASKAQRKYAESIATKTLNKLDEYGSKSESHQPGDELSSDVIELERKLKESISRLQCEKEKLMASLLPVSTNLQDIIDKNSFSSGSATSSYYEDPTFEINANPNGTTLYLENAILRQELTKLKEERTDLRAQIFMDQKERDLHVLTLLAKDTELEACRIQNKYLSKKIENENQTNDDAASSFKTNQIVKEFTQTLDKLSAQIDYKTRKTEAYINDLKQANQNFVETTKKMRVKYKKRFERLKIDHDSKCNAFESKIMALQATIQDMTKESARNFDIDGQKVKFETEL